MIVLLNCLMLLISIFSYIDIVDMSMISVVSGLGNGLVLVNSLRPSDANMRQ